MDDGLGAHILKSPFTVVELRRYAMQPGRRDELIALFEREFLETQEACGMVPFGHYRDLADPDSFVWLRGFARMEDRAPALDAFYRHSSAWKNNRDAANATLLDSDNVLLLRNARPESGADLSGLARPDAAFASSTVAISIFMLDARATDAFVAAFEKHLLPELAAIGERVAYFVSEERRNDFPALPVRETEFAFVIAGICRSDAAVSGWEKACESFEVAQARDVRISSRETLRLAPADRSLFQ